MILAFDIGATHTRAAYVVGKKVIEKKVIDTPKIKKDIKKAIIELAMKFRKADKICVGVASFLKDRRLTVNTSNMDFSNVDVCELFSKRLKLETFVDNDANCAGLAELVYGEGKGKKNFVLLTLGTGIGGAIIIDGKLYRGNSFAGEPGHIIVQGTMLEERASGPATLKRAEYYGLHNLKNEDIKKLADEGDKRALNLYREVGMYLGIGLLNLAYILDPEIIIIGGGFSKVHYIIENAKDFLHSHDLIRRKIPVVLAKFGDDAGLIGAALLASKKYG